MIGLKLGHKGRQVREVSAQIYINLLAKHLEDSKVVEAPSWSDLVKLACFNEMPPAAQNWWFVRVASVARQVYLHPGTSVQALRNRYGDGQRNGTSPNHHRQAAKKIIREALQQLEKLGWVSCDATKGRAITSKGQKALDAIAQQIA